MTTIAKINEDSIVIKIEIKKGEKITDLNLIEVIILDIDIYELLNKLNKTN